MSVPRIEPGPRQESVWDYPRPPRLEKTTDRLRVMFAGRVIGDTVAGYRVLETSRPPVYYLPLTDIDGACLQEAPGSSFCEFKGHARYWSLEIGGRVADRAAWSYPNPTSQFRPIRDHLAFYASRVDGCWIGDEQVLAQEADFYGGWHLANRRSIQGRGRHARMVEQFRG